MTSGGSPAGVSVTRRTLIVLGALIAVLLGAAAPATAHAALLSTDPTAGSVVRTAPQQVRLTFSEGVLLSADSLRVLDPAGRRVDSGTPQHADDDEATAIVALRPGLPDGTFTVAWKAVSQDSHPVAGAFTFSIGSPSTTTVALPAQQAGGGLAGTLYGIARFIAYSGFALLVGACLFVGVCWPRGALLRPMQRLAVGGWTALVASTIALLMLRGPYVNGTGLGGAFDLAAIRDVLQTRPGAALVSRLLLLAAAAVFLAVLFGSYTRRESSTDAKERAERADLAWGLGIGGTVVSAGIAATWAMAEHASVGIQSGVAMPVDVLHLLAMAVWLGGLAALLTALAAGLGIERQAVQRFSRAAFAAVTVLVGTGIYQSWRQVGSWNALISTSYGRLLLVKIGLVTVLVGLAWISRRWTARLGDPAAARRAPAMAAASPVKQTAEQTVRQTATRTAKLPVKQRAAGSGDPAAATDPVREAQLRRQRAARDKASAQRVRDADVERGGLRRSVLAEAAVAVVVLAATTALTGTQPGRAADRQGGAASAPVSQAPQLPQPVNLDIPYDTGGANGKGRAEVSLDPGRVGGNVLHLLIARPDGQPVDIPEVTVRLTLKAKNIGPIGVPLRHIDTGHWSATGVQLPMAGSWELSVTVRTSDIDQATETRNVEITG